MMILIVMVTILMKKLPKKQTKNNIRTFQQKYTNSRDLYLVKKGPTNSGLGSPPLYFHVIIDFGHIWGPFMAEIEKMCQKSVFLVVPDFGYPQSRGPP